MGRRVKKSVYDYSAGSWQLNEEKLFVYDGWNLVEEITVVGATETSRYFVWGLDLSQRLQGAGGIGGLLATVDASDTYYFAYDGKGNVAQVVDASSGTLAAAYQYDPFGNLIKADGAHADTNPFRFSTKYHDDETGLVYYGYRYYSPELGRWTRKDPIGERGGFNLYSFISNSVIDGYDYIGLKYNSYSDFGNSLKAHQDPNKDVPMPEKIDWEAVEDTIYEINEALYPESESSLAEDISQRINQGKDPGYIEFTSAKYSGWEFHLLFGGGQVNVRCCDGQYLRYHVYYKICMGAALDFSAASGIVSNSDGESCENPPVNLLGAEFGVGYLNAGVEAGVTFDMSGQSGASVSIGGGPGRTPIYPEAIYSAKATFCYYRLWESSETSTCCSLK